MAENTSKDVDHDDVRKDIIESFAGFHRIVCPFRVGCASAKDECLRVKSSDIPADGKPECYVPRPKKKWYDEDWNDLQRVTWVDVFSLQSVFMYVALITVIVSFMSLLMMISVVMPVLKIA